MITKSLTTQKRSLNAKPGQKGYTLVELSISLAIISVILVGALTGVQQLIQNNNSNSTLSSAQSALGNMMKVASVANNQDVFEDTLNLGALGAWDPSFLLKNASGTVTNIRNPFGGFVHTARNGVTTGTTPAGSGLWYTITGVPNSACYTTASSFNTNSLAIIVSRGNAAGATKSNYAFNGVVHTNGGTAGVSYSPGGGNPLNAVGNAAISAATSPKLNGGNLSVANLQANCTETTNGTKDIHILVSAS